MSDAPQVVFDAIDFASGQEPLNSQDFACLVRADFTVAGTTLATAVKKQRRVLDRYLETASGREILSRIAEDKEVLRIVTFMIRSMVTRYIAAEFKDRPPAMNVTVAAESDLPFVVKVDPRALAARVEMEFDVISGD